MELVCIKQNLIAILRADSHNLRNTRRQYQADTRYPEPQEMAVCFSVQLSVGATLPVLVTTMAHCAGVVAEPPRLEKYLGPTRDRPWE